MSSLPAPYLLQWKHATNSLAKVDKAMRDSKVTAIEADLVMGCETDPGEKDPDACPLVPIVAHPSVLRPPRQTHIKSDMTVSTFLTRVCTGDDGTLNLFKHIKLDFKTLDVVDPTLTELDHLAIRNPYGKTVFLNADILPGPGSRSKATMPADAFITTCLEHIENLKVRNYFLPVVIVCQT